MEYGLDPALTDPVPYANSESSSSHGGLELENKAPGAPVGATAGQHLFEIRNELGSMAQRQH